MQADRPVLAVDVDGVISLFGFDQPFSQEGARYHLIDGVPHCISNHAGSCARRTGQMNAGTAA